MPSQETDILSVLGPDLKTTYGYSLNNRYKTGVFPAQSVAMVLLKNSHLSQGTVVAKTVYDLLT